MQSAGERMESFRAQAAQCRDRLAAAEAENRTAAEALAKAKEEKQSVESRLTSRQGRQDQLSTQLEQLAARLSAFSVRRVVLEKDLEAARVRKENLGKERAEAAARQQQLKERYKSWMKPFPNWKTISKPVNRKLIPLPGRLPTMKRKMSRFWQNVPGWRVKPSLCGRNRGKHRSRRNALPANRRGWMNRNRPFNGIMTTLFPDCGKSMS